MTAVAKFYHGTNTEIENKEYEEGSFYVDTDNAKLYVDLEDKRLPLNEAAESAPEEIFEKLPYLFDQVWYGDPDFYPLSPDSDAIVEGTDDTWRFDYADEAGYFGDPDSYKINTGITGDKDTGRYINGNPFPRKGDLVLDTSTYVLGVITAEPEVDENGELIEGTENTYWEVKQVFYLSDIVSNWFYNSGYTDSEGNWHQNGIQWMDNIQYKPFSGVIDFVNNVNGNPRHCLRRYYNFDYDSNKTFGTNGSFNRNPYFYSYYQDGNPGEGKKTYLDVTVGMNSLVGAGNVFLYNGVFKEDLQLPEYESTPYDYWLYKRNNDEEWAAFLSRLSPLSAEYYLTNEEIQEEVNGTNVSRIYDKLERYTSPQTEYDCLIDKTGEIIRPYKRGRFYSEELQFKIERPSIYGIATEDEISALFS